jgi:hypothetical protein
VRSPIPITDRRYLLERRRHHRRRGLARTGWGFKTALDLLSRTATWLTVHYGVGHVGLYLVAMVLLSLAAQLCMQETKTPSLDTPDTAGVL